MIVSLDIAKSTGIALAYNYDYGPTTIELHEITGNKFDLAYFLSVMCLKEYVDTFLIEQVFIGPNRKTAITLAETVGYVEGSLKVQHPTAEFKRYYPASYRRWHPDLKNKLNYFDYFKKQQHIENVGQLTNNMSDALTMLLWHMKILPDELNNFDVKAFLPVKMTYSELGSIENLKGII